MILTMEFKILLAKIDNWDQKIILRWNGIGGKFFTNILKIFSFFGRETIWIFLITYFLFIWYDPLLFSYFSSTFLIGLILILTIKQMVSRTRPFEKFGEEKILVLGRKPSSRSFPSWHSYNVVSQGLLIGLYFLKSPVITIIALLLAILISFSRIQLGVHYPSDVIFGYLFGILGFILSIFLVAPIIFNIITYLEQFSAQEIQYRQLNSMFYENIWYFILCMMIFCIILILAVYKSIIKEPIK